MKKNKIIIILFILILTGCQSNNEKNKIEDLFEKNIQIKNIKCSDINKYSIIDAEWDMSTYPESIVLLSNGMVYDLTKELFSNDQQCKAIGEDIKFKAIDYHSNYEGGFYLISEDNERYLYKNGKLELYYKNLIPSVLSNVSRVSNSSIQLNEDQLKKYGLTSNNKEDGKEVYTGYNKYIYIKDGSIYEGIVKLKHYYNYEENRDIELSSELLEEKILYYKEEYGNIYDYNELTELNDNSIIISDNGVFNYTDIQTEECNKYEDIKCEKKFIKNEKIDKYMSNIKFINVSYVVTNDNSFIRLRDILLSLK